MRTSDDAANHSDRQRVVCLDELRYLSNDSLVESKVSPVRIHFSSGSASGGCFGTQVAQVALR